mmetsp:Transcript_3505/g.4664  ORF Transcript_3505/g.4664 Transcript_3505/m.4664 type:complete len:111 (+) Transcript_3505:247-579(+)
MDALHYNIALNIDEKTSNGSPGNSYVRVQHYFLERVENNELKYTWLNTTTCAKLIKKLAGPEKIEALMNSAEWKFFVDEFHEKGSFESWLCPDITQISLEKDPWSFKDGK